MTEQTTKVAEELEGEVEMKKDKASKKDDKEGCDCDDQDATMESAKTPIVQPYKIPETVDENIALMFNGQELSEEFKKKASTIFEAAVATRVNAEIAKIEEEAQEAITLKLAEAEAKTTAQVDEYMEHVVAEWAEENKIALEAGIRQEIAESIITDLKTLFEKHNISIPAEKVDMLEASDAENEALRGEVNSLTEKLIATEAKIFEMEKQNILSGLAEGLAVTQVEKLSNLIKEVDAKSIETFKEKATILRDSMFVETKSSVKTDEKTVKPINESEALMSKIYSSYRNKD